MLKFKVYSNSPDTSPARILLNSEVIGPRNKNWQKTPRFHGSRALNEIFSNGLGLSDDDPPHNNFNEQYTIVEVFDEPLPILKKLFSVLPFRHKNLKNGKIYEKEVVFAVQSYYSVSNFSLSLKQME
jgi:hypothetical protein